MCPVMSMCTGLEYADIAIPTYECLAHAFSVSDNPTLWPMGPAVRLVKTPPLKNLPKWSDRIPIAVFRGSSTGAGTTVQNNQRLKAVSFSMEHPELLDAGITKWNLRPRKRTGDPEYSTIAPGQWPPHKDYPPLADSLTPEQQANYKYILCLWGHAPAFRLIRDLSLGSVVLLADVPPGQKRLELWFYNLLVPWVHYVPVKGDLSDLATVIQWCRDNNQKCSAIATAGTILAREKLGMDGQMNRLLKAVESVRIRSNPLGYEIPQSPVDVAYFMMTRHLASLGKRLTKFKPTGPPPRLPRCHGTMKGMQMAYEAGWPVPNVAVRKHGGWYEDVSVAFLGLIFFNSLMYRIPHFKYVYGFKTPTAPPEIRSFLSAESPGVGVETFLGEKSLGEWIDDGGWKEERQLALMLCQVTFALQEAQAAGGAVLGDLSVETVYAVPYPLEEYVYHDGRGGSFGLKLYPADRWAVIETGPRARARVKTLELDGRPGWLITAGRPETDNMAETAYHDLCCLLTSLLQRLVYVGHNATKDLAVKLILAANADFREAERQANDVNSGQYAPEEGRSPLTIAGPEEFRAGLVREFKLTEIGAVWADPSKPISDTYRIWERGLPRFGPYLWLTGNREAAVRAVVKDALESAPPQPSTALGLKQARQEYERRIGSDLINDIRWRPAHLHLTRYLKRPFSQFERSPGFTWSVGSVKTVSVPAWAESKHARTSTTKLPERFNPASWGNAVEAIGQDSMRDKQMAKLVARTDPVDLHAYWARVAELTFDRAQWTETAFPVAKLIDAGE
ncbi:tyrosine kinase [Singapore grouper iridovirus]|uniref:Tyrosine kinase n=1 Tax=Singapore grouper iridovirus TaxID=262968 RepID=Q5YFI7_9VIRU|nr:tyrosine kinase [Singapore grouper iridovirus]AAS18093.1 tyrosine kinase [Singapore grouper iridovirus]WAU86787.1 tyrosine kinase [Singapore grouper iridovirus]